MNHKHIFVSYSTDDHKFVDELIKKFDESDVLYWYDRSIKKGTEDWRVEIDQALFSSTLILVIMSNAANQSEYVTYEWAHALGQGKPIYMVMTEKVEDIHERLRTIQYLDFTESVKPWNDLIEEITKLHYEQLELDPQSTKEFRDNLKGVVRELLASKLIEKKHLSVFSIYNLLSTDDIMNIDDTDEDSD